jgi:hypothetical protein
MILRAEFASWREPYWWVEDKAGFRYVMPLALHRTTHADGGAVIWSLIVGPLCLRLGYRTSNNGVTGVTTAGRNVP